MLEHRDGPKAPARCSEGPKFSPKHSSKILGRPRKAARDEIERLIRGEGSEAAATKAMERKRVAPPKVVRQEQSERRYCGEIAWTACRLRENKGPRDGPDPLKEREGPARRQVGSKSITTSKRGHSAPRFIHSMGQVPDHEPVRLLHWLGPTKPNLRPMKPFRCRANAA